VRITDAQLIAHVGCGAVDDVGCCVFCELIRARLRRAVAKAGEAPKADAVRLSPDAENRERIQQLEAEIQRLTDALKTDTFREALEYIRDNDPDCQCDHADDFCCARPGSAATTFCARCIAALALDALSPSVGEFGCASAIPTDSERETKDCESALPETPHEKSKP
jgi:hypothetical protein